MNQGPAIVARNLRKAYQLFDSPFQLAAHAFGFDRFISERANDGKTFVALDDVTFSIAAGERVAILGRNGAGKSTLVKIIAGLCHPSGGDVRVNGTVQVLAAGAQTMQPEMTGYQNIEAALLHSGLGKKERVRAFADVVDFVELGDYLHQPFGSYSLGMQARTQFAVATAIRPTILLIDELLGAGDGYFAAKSADRMKALIDSGAAILLVSHSPQAVLQYCDRAIWLKAGRIAQDGKVADVLAAYERDMQAAALAQTGHAATVSAAREAFRLPRELCTTFVERQIAQAEPIESGARATPVQGNTQSGLQVMSYRGPGPLRIVAVNWSAEPLPPGGIRVGSELHLELAVKGTASYTGRIRCSVLVYSLSGRRCASLSSAPLDISLSEGETLIMRGIVTRLMLGTANYVMSVLVEDASSTPFTCASRHDLWSKCGALIFEPCNDSDPPFVHLDATWHFGDATSGEPARLSAVQ